MHFVESRLLHFDCKLFPFVVGLTCIIFIAAYLAGNRLFPANIREDILEMRTKLEAWKCAFPHPCEIVLLYFTLQSYS